MAAAFTSLAWLPVVCLIAILLNSYHTSNDNNICLIFFMILLDHSLKEMPLIINNHKLHLPERFRELTVVFFIIPRSKISIPLDPMQLLVRC